MGLPLPSSPPGTDLPQCDDPLLGARNATLQHDEVVVDLPVVREATLRERTSRKEALGLGAAEKTRGTPLAWGDTLDHIRTVSEPDPKSILRLSYLKLCILQRGKLRLGVGGDVTAPSPAAAASCSWGVSPGSLAPRVESELLHPELWESSWRTCCLQRRF